MFCAHIKPTTLNEQSVKEHLYNVSRLSAEFGEKIGLPTTARLIGLLHDFGKETEVFDTYIRYSAANSKDKSLRGSIDHSTSGARFVYENYFSSGDVYQKFTAQIISLAICSHHGGLVDCLDLKGYDKFTDRIMKKEDIHYEEAKSVFISECMEMDQISELFKRAKEEINRVVTNINKIDKSPKFRLFAAGVLVKYLFSCLIDADRFDTYEFMADVEQQQTIDKSNLWTQLSSVLENKLKEFRKVTKIDLLREEISLSCKNFGKNNTGIYQLSVPTGGGKTFSSLRYALEHAKEFNKDRIFYIIPFTTIIDQNAKEIKDILGSEDVVLEHHSNLIVDNDNEDYKLLTERWDSPIILTTMVQFLDTLFSGGTQGVRRMHNLANSIIIFDEIQAIPIKCINMFNSAINFLSYICNTTVILCTATQPLLATTKMPLKLNDNANMISNIHEKFKQFKRVNLFDKRIIGGYRTEQVKDFVIDRMEEVQSVLVILNTKNSAKEVFRLLKKANDNLPAERQYLIFHLSTSMCPSHRISILKEIRKKLEDQRVICISTQLIEAGVNISFGCVVRALAGLDSIAQAAGRCNRHGERSCSNVFIINLEGENVSKLIDIKEGQKCTERVLDEFKQNPNAFDNDLLSPKTMERYYQYYFHNRKGEMDYRLPKPDSDKQMYDLLSDNFEGTNAYRGRNSRDPVVIMKQAFKTAGDYFQVIDQNTIGVVVPYGRGKELITLINGVCNLSELKHYLKEAQQYSVNLFEPERRKLEELGGFVKLRDGAVLALRDGFYGEDVGVSFESKPMEFLDF